MALISEDDFETIWQPQDNTKGQPTWECDEIPQGTPAETVWSLVDGDDGGAYALPGYHLVNVFGYVITKKPWIDGSEEAVWSEPHCGFCGRTWPPTEPETIYPERCEICGNCNEHHDEDVHTK